ncbi:MAG: alpha/beta hydrolase, partial [Okeania sp. SIO2H7]|nr:alpha/beta hydrolase [Okeania sp. SIO2H7]
KREGYPLNSLPEKPSPIIPKTEQLSQVKNTIDTRISNIDANSNRRVGAYPYYLFHPPEKPILGTIIIFHSFGAIPHQMSLLAKSLFNNGFNIYQPCLAGHAFIPPEKYWPQAHIKPKLASLIKEKIKEDAVLQNYLNNIDANLDKFNFPTAREQEILRERLLKIEPRLEDFFWAIERESDKDFYRYFNSESLKYLIDARARLAELAAMPGPIYAIGLSVGATVALSLAATEPQRVKKVVAYAPLLKIREPKLSGFLHIAGLLNLKQNIWEENLYSSMEGLIAAVHLGKLLMVSQKRRNLWKVPTLFVLTENDEIADIEKPQKFVEAIRGKWKGHRCYVYPRIDLVPHQMVDPRSPSNGMSNIFWRNLYRETRRFLQFGDIKEEKMGDLG